MKVGISDSERTKKKEVKVRKTKKEESLRENNSKDRVGKNKNTGGDNSRSVVGQWCNRTSDEFRVCKKTRV